MFELIKIVHFLSIVAGIGAGVANIVAGARLKFSQPEQAKTVGAFRMTMAQISTVGLIGLWLTGLAMIAMSGTEFATSSEAFQWKIAAVVVLSIISATSNTIVFRAKRAGKPPNFMHLSRLGMSAQLFAIAALILAVFAFS
jgi:hypothetical protein